MVGHGLVGSVVHNLTKDHRLTIRRAVTLARQFRALDPAHLATITFPVDRAVQRNGVVRRTGQLRLLLRFVRNIADQSRR